MGIRSEYYAAIIKITFFEKIHSRFDFFLRNLWIRYIFLLLFCLRMSSNNTPRKYAPPRIVERDDRGEESDEAHSDEEAQQLPRKVAPNDETSRIVRTVVHEEEKNFFMRFQKNHPVLTVLIASLILIIVILAIVLPLTLVKKKAEKMISPKCPDGNKQPRIDCLPDRKLLTEKGANLETTCRTRMCCWSASVEMGGPNCAFHTNYGFRNAKTKENSFASQWYELTRLNSPNSYAKSDIANLEARIEMHTDSRLRIRVIYRKKRVVPHLKRVY